MIFRDLGFPGGAQSDGEQGLEGAGDVMRPPSGPR